MSSRVYDDLGGLGQSAIAARREPTNSADHRDVGNRGGDDLVPRISSVRVLDQGDGIPDLDERTLERGRAGIARARAALHGSTDAP